MVVEEHQAVLVVDVVLQVEEKDHLELLVLEGVLHLVVQKALVAL